MKDVSFNQGQSGKPMSGRFLFLLGCALSLGVITTRAAEHAPAKEPSQTVSTNERTLIHPALQKTGDLIASTNLSTAVHSDPRTEQEKEYQMLYDLARTQRSQRNVDMATRNFVALLQGGSS